MSLEDSLRSIRDARGLRVNEDLIVWAARLETGRLRSGRPGVTLEVLQDTWRKMHITVLPKENEDLMKILVEHREQQAAQPSEQEPDQPDPAPDELGTQPAATAAQSGSSGPPAWYRPPELEPEPAAPQHPDHSSPAASVNGVDGPTQWVGAGTIASLPDAGRDTRTHQPQSRPAPTPPPMSQGVQPGPQRQPAGQPPAAEHPGPPLPQQPPSQTWQHSPQPSPAHPGNRPLPDPTMFSGQADVLNPHDGYMGLTARPDRVDLMWEEAHHPGEVVLYLIVGSPSSIPNTAQEGERLAVTADSHLGVAPGYRYYAVFVYRGDSPIAAARNPKAVRQAVGQVVPPPLQVDYVINPDSVVLEWQQPPLVNGVQLRRSRPDEPLPSFADASLVKQVLPGQTSFLDLDVEPGRTYSYELVCLANAPRLDGGVDQSAPWSSGPVVIPALPSRVDGLEGAIIDVDGQVKCRLRWPVAPRGKVSIFAKTGDPGVLGEIAPDRMLTAEELTRLPLGNRVVWSGTRDGDFDTLDGFAVDVTVSPEWCYTPVTELAGKYVLGRSVVLTHVGAIGEVDFSDRLTWQFLRFEWPSGAAEVVAEVDGARHRTSKEKYELYGGIRLNLPAYATTVTIWGTRTYRGVALSGKPTTVPYPGRRVIYYQIEYSPAGQSRRVHVRPEVPLGAMELAVIGGTDLYPISPTQLTSPGFGVVHPISAPAGTLDPTRWVSFDFVQPPQARYLRLFARAADGQPVAAVEWPAAAAPVQRRAQRCPNCLAPPNPKNQFFRCSSEGSCEPQEDELLTRVRGVTTVAKPWSLHPVERDQRVGQILCAHCNTATRDEFCAECGETFPTSDWWRADSFAATLLGPKNSGKTSILQAECYALTDGLAETWGGHAAGLDPASRSLMKRYHDEWESGKLQHSTVAAKSNRDVLRPLQIGIAFPQYPRPVAISLFDVAGEDMEEPDLIAQYSHSLLNGDALIYLVDPLQISEVRTALAGFVTLPDPGVATPVQALQNLISVLRRKYGMTAPVPTRLAVVFSKFDAVVQATSVPGSPIADLLPYDSALLRDPYSNPVGPPAVYDSTDGLAVHQEARTLLSVLGGASVLNLVERNFGNFQYFVCSSTGHTPAGNSMHSTARAPHRLFDPLRWLIQG